MHPPSLSNLRRPLFGLRPTLRSSAPDRGSVHKGKKAKKLEKRKGKLEGKETEEETKEEDMKEDVKQEDNRG